ncbi:MoaD/ThiS family protein [Actinomadura miaoliensis]|uniref:MoaD/ThiS family protein n=1 Tax=Actinomadura miaoliensis TaxID=430685 RepID=A0ABP7VQ93_9ACTN
MVTIIVPMVWTADGTTRFQTAAGPLAEVIRRFAAERPDCRDRVLGPDGEPLMYVNVCVDDELVPRDRRAGTVVADGSTVTLIAPMAGG